LLWADPGQDPVDVNAWGLRISLIRTLERSRRGYLKGMIGASLMGLNPDDPDDAFQAADTWFSAVMERALELHGSRPTHKAHEVFRQVILRGHGWPKAWLERSFDPPQGAAPDAVIGAFGRLDATLTPSAPPSRITEKLGTLVTIADSASQETPEGMSLWQAVSLGPQKLDPGTADGRDAFFYAVIQALETANEVWETLRRIGLSPRDWAGAVTINQAKGASVFVNEARRIAEETGAALTDHPVLEAAWAIRKVTRFADLDDFLGSEMGRALLQGPGPINAVPLEAAPEIADEDDSLASLEEMTSAIAYLAQNDALDSLDQQVLAAIVQRNVYEDVCDEDWCARAFPTKAAWAEYTDKLVDKILEVMTPGSEHTIEEAPA
ncbi:MAG: hypothetical protein AAGB15_10890, partial [Pseudomonadota bacterium]